MLQRLCRPLAPAIHTHMSEHLYPAKERARAKPISRQQINWFEAVLLSRDFNLPIHRMTVAEISMLICASKSHDALR